MRIAITGSTGFIGSAIVRRLLAGGHEVALLIRESSSLDRLHAQKDMCHTLVYSALGEPALATRLAAWRPDGFVHAAWKGVGAADRNEAFHHVENLPMVLDSVRLAAGAGCTRWLGLGSQAEYGNPNRLVDENAPIRPTHAYGEAKAEAGRQALAFCRSAGIAGSWVRVFSTYGPGDASHWLIPYAIGQFLDGTAPRLSPCEQIWDYLFVDDAAEAVASLLEAASSGVYNLGSGTAVRLREVIEQLQALTGGPAPVYGAQAYRPDQVLHLQADVSALAKATGWRPRTSLETGLRLTVEHALSRRLAEAPSSSTVP